MPSDTILLIGGPRHGDIMSAYAAGSFGRFNVAVTQGLPVYEPCDRLNALVPTYRTVEYRPLTTAFCGYDEDRSSYSYRQKVSYRRDIWTCEKPETAFDLLRTYLFEQWVKGGERA